MCPFNKFSSFFNFLIGVKKFIIKGDGKEYVGKENLGEVRKKIFKIKYNVT